MPPEYYVNNYNKLVNVNQPGLLTRIPTLITIIVNDKKHLQGMSHHFATVGTPSERLIDYACNMIVVSSRTTPGPGMEWVNNFEDLLHVPCHIRMITDLMHCAIVKPYAQRGATRCGATRRGATRRSHNAERSHNDAERQ